MKNDSGLSLNFFKVLHPYCDSYTYRHIMLNRDFSSVLVISA